MTLKQGNFMKNLYARFVLWLIRPALDLRNPVQSLSESERQALIESVARAVPESFVCAHLRHPRA